MLGAGTERTKFMQLLFVSRVSLRGIIIGMQSADSSWRELSPLSPQHSTARSSPVSAVLTNVCIQYHNFVYHNIMKCLFRQFKNGSFLTYFCGQGHGSSHGPETVQRRQTLPLHQID